MIVLSDHNWINKKRNNIKTFIKNLSKLKIHKQYRLLLNNTVNNLANNYNQKLSL